MDYLTNYYKNICEQLQKKVNNLENYLNEVAESGINVADGGLTQEPIPQEEPPIRIPDTQGPRDQSIPPSPYDYFGWCMQNGCGPNNPPDIREYDQNGDGKISDEERHNWQVDRDRWQEKKNLYTKHMREYSISKSRQRGRR